MLKQLAKAKLPCPTHAKYPRKAVQSFMRPEKLHISESNMIAEGVYHIVLKSEEFFYFMSGSPRMLGSAINIEHPFVPNSLRIPISNSLMKFRYTVPNPSLKLGFFPHLRCNKGRVEDQLSTVGGPISSGQLSAGTAEVDGRGSTRNSNSTKSDLRSDCCRLFSSHSKSEGLNTLLTESHKMELRGEIYRWHNGELHLIVQMQDMLNTNPLNRLLCAVGTGGEVLAEGPFGIGLVAEQLRVPSQHTVIVLQAQYIPLYAGLIMELLQPTASLNYSINSSNMPSEMDIDKRYGAMHSGLSCSDIMPETHLLRQHSDHLQEWKHNFAMRFVVQADTIEEAYAFGFDMLEYLLKSVTQTDTNFPRHPGGECFTCSVSLYVLSEADPPLLRLMLQEEDIMQDGELQARHLEDVLTEEVSKLYISGSEEFVARIEAIVPDLPYKRNDLMVLRFM